MKRILSYVGFLSVAVFLFAGFSFSKAHAAAGDITVNIKNEFGTAVSITGDVDYICTGGATQTQAVVAANTVTFTPLAGADCANGESITITVYGAGDEGYLKWISSGLTYNTIADPNLYNSANKFTLLVTMKNELTSALTSGTAAGQFDPNATVGTISGERNPANTLIGYPVPVGRANDTFTVTDIDGYVNYESGATAIPANEDSAQITSDSANKFSQKVIATSTPDIPFTGATVTAGSASTACIESGAGVYYCPVVVAEDGISDDISIIKATYTTVTGSTVDRSLASDAQGEIYIDMSGSVLTNYKETASSTLDSTYAGYYAASTTYSVDNFTTLTGFYTTGISDVNISSDIAGVDMATSTAISGMDGVQTLSEQLDTYKLTASSTLDAAYAGYIDTDYSGANWTTLTGYYNTGIASTSEAISIAEVDTATSTAIFGMAGVLTLDQEDAVSVESVRAALDLASSTAYIDIQVSSSTDQTELTVALGLVVYSIASSTDTTVSVMTTFDLPNYSVAISKNATSSTYIITNATFSTSVADAAAVVPVMGLIDAVSGTTTSLSNIGNVYAARSAYDALTVSQKALITSHYDSLVLAEAQIPALFTEMFNTVHTQLEVAGILNNIDTCGGASSTACSGLYFQKTGYGKITFPGTLDLTSTSTIATLSALDTGISFANGEITFTAQAGDAFKVLGGELEMYSLTFASTPSIFVDGILSTVDDVETVTYSSSTGILTFTAKHFTTFDTRDTAKAITAYSFVGLGTGVINEGDHTIAVTVPYGTDVTDLIATFTITGSEITTPAEIPIVQASGVTVNDFSSPVIYTVTAENSSTQNYTVTVTVAANSAKAITGFAIPSQVGTTTISESAHTITVVMPNGTDVSALVPTIITTGDSVSPVSGLANDFTSTTTYTVTAANASTQAYVVTVQVLESTQTAPAEDGTATISTTTPEVVITNPTATTTLTINSGVTNPTIDVSAFIGSNGTGTIPAIIIDSPVADVTIPASTLVTSASTTWNGIITAPIATTITLPTESGVTKTFSAGIEVGFSGVALTFDKAVRILLPGQAGKRVGYTRDAGTTFTEITTTCSADTQVAGDAMPAGAECKMDSGSDLVIWTKHFTTFASYSQTTNTVSSGGGGWLPPVVVPVATSTTAVLTTTTTTAIPTVGYKFTKDLQVGSKGADVTELQKLLVAEGHLIMPQGVAYGYFGNATKAALIKYQLAKGITPAAGYFGPKTMKVMTSSNVSTSNIPATKNIASMTLKELVQMLLQIGAIASDKIDAANKLINSL